MTYEEALHYLYHSLPQFSKIGIKAYKADLKNTLLLCEYLDHPEKKIKTIHVAGTNGKGSVSHMLSAIMQENNYKTGLYTSPHLQDFRERIKINGQMISKSFVTGFMEKIIPFSEKVKPSFFELTVAMALDYFSTEKVDVAIIETGLGGRLDSTNVIIPILSVITNIGYDHVDILGNTLAKIAFEKAGIIKQNVPVVIGEYNEETKPVFIDKATIENAPISFASEIYKVIDSKYSSTNLELNVMNNETNIVANYLLDLNGLYQQKNILSVLSAVNLLKKDLLLSEDKTVSALAKVKTLTGFHGRWDIIRDNPLVVLDVAHNEDGMRQLVSQIVQINFTNLHIIFGMVKDKDIEKVLQLLPKNAKYYFTNAQIERALPAEDLQNKAAKYQLPGEVFDEVNKAVASALNIASEKDLVIVCGSLFVVGEVNISAIKEWKSTRKMVE